MAPGVYLLRDGQGQVLYVGKAKNLRHRLGSYRVANPDRMPRRTVRLLHLARTITWEETVTETAALARESELLLSLRPKFNRAGVWLGSTRLIAWRASPKGVELAVLENASPGWTLAGPFGADAPRVQRALVRLLWCRFHPDAGLAQMPAGWFEGHFGREVCVPASHSELVEQACLRLRELAGTQYEVFHDWLLPVRHSFELPCREEDLDFVTERLVTRLIVETV